MDDIEIDETFGEDIEFLAVSRLAMPLLIGRFNAENESTPHFSKSLTDQLKATTPIFCLGFLPIIGAINNPANSWFIGLSAGFKKDIDNLDRKVQGRVLEAIAEIVDAPVTAKGNTVKPLTKEEKFKGCWRYRIGDYRLIYHPNGGAKQVTLIAFEARGDVY